jgi:hypothetical protein
VNATGPGAIAGAIGVINRTVDQPNFGISIATQFNDTGTTANVQAASGAHGNRVRLNSTGSNTNGVAASGTEGNRVRSSLNPAPNRTETTSPAVPTRKSVSDRITTSTKKFRDNVHKVTGGSPKGAKAGAASNSDK